MACERSRRIRRSRRVVASMAFAPSVAGVVVLLAGVVAVTNMAQVLGARRMDAPRGALGRRRVPERAEVGERAGALAVSRRREGGELPAAYLRGDQRAHVRDPQRARHLEAALETHLGVPSADVRNPSGRKVCDWKPLWPALFPSMASSMTTGEWRQFWLRMNKRVETEFGSGGVDRTASLVALNAMAGQFRVRADVCLRMGWSKTIDCIVAKDHQ